MNRDTELPDCGEIYARLDLLRHEKWGTEAEQAERVKYIDRLIDTFNSFESSHALVHTFLHHCGDELDIKAYVLTHIVDDLRKLPEQARRYIVNELKEGL